MLAVAACGSSSGGSPLSSAGGSKAPSDSIVVGSANFPENVLLADIYADALSAKGVKVSTKLNIGSREVYIPALKDGSIDLIPEYSGVLLQYFQPSATQVTLGRRLHRAADGRARTAHGAEPVGRGGQGRSGGHQGDRRQVPPDVHR